MLHRAETWQTTPANVTTPRPSSQNGNVTGTSIGRFAPNGIRDAANLAWKLGLPKERVISTIAGLHFAPTFANLQNLVRENVPVSQVFVTGNSGIDALQWASKMEVDFADPKRRRGYTFSFTILRLP